MDKENKKYNDLHRDRVISVSDLIEEILRKIWFIIILAVVFAIFFAGYKYMSDKSAAESSMNSESYEKAEETLTDEEMREVDSVLKLYDEVDSQEEYLEKSVLMNIDPYHEDRVIMQFALHTDAGVMTNALQAVSNYVTGGSLVTDLQYSDMDSAYLSELISYKQGTADEQDSETNVEDEVVSTTSIFWIRIVHSDQDAAEKLAEDVKKCLESYSENLDDYFGTCKITFLQQSATQVYDSDLKSNQNSVVSDQITLQNRIATQTESLNNDQIKLVEASLIGETDMGSANDDKSTLNEDAAQSTVKIHISKRYISIGILVGVVVGIILITLFYICRGTLNVAQEMQIDFHIPVFGQLHVKKPGNPLVRGWRRLVNKKKALSLETEQRIALTSLRSFCKNHQVDRILLTGSREGLSENTWLKSVQEALRTEGVEVETADCFSDSPEILERLNEFSHITLVETLHASLYKDVIRELEICREQSIQVAGTILYS